jgi:cell division protein FtsL
MIRTGSGLSDPRSFMAEYYQSKAKMDTIRQDRDLKVQEETLKLEKAKFEMERKRLKTQENKSLIESYAEISKMNFETLKMRQKMKSESEMSEDEIAALFPLLEYPPKPSWS